MKALKWLDEHFEEVLLITLLVIISCVELVQVVARNVPFIGSLTWAEELCRFAWIATVFLSLPYTIRTCTTLRVTALLELLPWKLQNAMNIIIDLFTAFILGVLSYYSVVVLQRIVASAETSPAMVWPMWIMYAIVVIGFVLGVFRSLEMFVIHIKHFNEPPANSVEAAAEFELAAEKRNAEGEAGYTASVDAALTNAGKGEA